MTATSTPETTRRRDPGIEAQEAAEAHLGACWEALDIEGDPASQDVEDPFEGIDLAGPFDGCPTCEVREVLHAAAPILLGALVDELDAAGHRDAARLIERSWSL